MMKKMKAAAFMSAILIFVLSISTGCSDIVPETSDVSKEAEVSIETVTGTNEVNDENTTETNEVTNDVNAEQWEIKAKSLYDDACKMYFGIIFNGSYFETNYNTTDGLGENFYEVSDSRVTTIEDVKAEMRKVFSESYASKYDNKISGRYKELDGKLYQGERGKGGNVALEGVDIEFISADDSKASFNAIAHYINEPDKIELFTLVYENGDWKVSEFSDPNLFMEYETGSVTDIPISTDNIEKEQWEVKARQLYSDARDIFFGIIINGTYFDTNDTIYDEQGILLNKISDSRVSNVADVKSEVRKIFSESYASQYDSHIGFVYKEVNGELYQINQNKGGLFSMEDIDIEFVSANDKKATFNAIVHTPDGTDVYGVDPFTLVYESGSWKVSEYTYY